MIVWYSSETQRPASVYVEVDGNYTTLSIAEYEETQRQLRKKEESA